jgi:CRP-like cAMP-binding protein
VVGELAFLLGTPRTATLEVEEPARVGTLRRTAYLSFARERPEIAVALLSYLVRIQAERITFANRMSMAFRT